MKFLSLVFIFLTITVSLFAQKEPDFLWGRATGGSLIATDSKGNVYTIGSIGEYTRINKTLYIANGKVDFYISKLDPVGNYIWTKQYSGAGTEWVNAIHIDSKDNIYLAGTYDTTTTLGGFTLTYSDTNGYDIFMLKLDTSGNITHANTLGASPLIEYSHNVMTTDEGGNLYLLSSLGRNSVDTFTFNNANFIAGEMDIFLFKYNNMGVLQWVKHAGGDKSDYGAGIEINKKGNIIITGSFSDTAFFDSTMITGSGIGYGRIFIAEYTSDGVLENVLNPDQNPFQWGSTQGSDVKTDTAGNTYIAGTIYDRIAIFGSDTINSLNYSSAYLVKYNGNWQVQWAKSIGDLIEDNPKIVIDKEQNIYTANASPFQDYTTTLSKYDSRGNLIWSNAEGPHKYQPAIYDIATSIDNSIYVTGLYDSISNIFNRDTLYPISYSNLSQNRVFIARIGPFPADIYKMYSSNTDLTLYPNPADDIIHITGSDLPSYSSYGIINISGHIITEGVIADNSQIKIFVANISPGIYIIKLKSDTHVKTLRFIKQDK